MTLNDPSLFIAVVLGCGAAAVLIGALIAARHARYRAPVSEPYAGFREAAHSGVEFLELECEGLCPGATAHEVTGSQGATCVLCGTHRVLPDAALADDA